MTTITFELQIGEEIIDTWPLLYSPPGGGSFAGRCTVTNLRIMYSSHMGMDTQHQLSEFMDPSMDNSNWLAIPKARIKEIETEKSYLEKRVILTLDNGQKHEFSYGALNIDRLVKAIRLKL